MSVYKPGRFFCLLLFVFASATHAESGTQLLNDHMKKLRTLDTAFTQEVVSEKGEIMQTSYGRFMLSRPGKFRWEYEQPSPQEIVSDGKSLWIYDKELEQVTVKPLSATLGASPAGLLMQQRDFDKDYVVLEKSRREGLDWVDLRPRDKSGDFQRILIGLDDDGIHAMDLYDQFGQTTMIRFRQPRFNSAIAGSKFEFTPPAGVDVIGQPAS